MGKIYSEFSEDLCEVIGEARKRSVSVSLTYVEGEDSWYWSVSSAADGENWIGKGTSSLYDATTYVLEWLCKLA